jgi:hypothetical protein
VRRGGIGGGAGNRLAAGEPVDPWLLTLQIAEDMIERSILEHEDDDVVDLVQAGHGLLPVGIAERLRLS